MFELIILRPLRFCEFGLAATMPKSILILALPTWGRALEFGQIERGNLAHQQIRAYKLFAIYGNVNCRLLGNFNRILGWTGWGEKNTEFKFPILSILMGCKPLPLSIDFLEK